MERYRINPDGYVYFVTYSVTDWLPVFVAERAFRIVADSLNFCCREKHLCVNAFVIMPTHVHAVVFDAEFSNERLQRSLADFRKYTGRELSDYCTKYMPPCFCDALREAAGEDRKRRFWQPTRHPEVSKRNASANRNATTFTIIRAERGWLPKRNTGDSRRRGTGFRMGRPQARWR